MTDYRKVLLAIAPHGKPAIRDGFADALRAAIAYADLSAPLRLPHFLAQWAHESDGFNALEEYASGKAYEGRKDLGNTQKGDGVRFKGRSPAMLTGRSNYTLAGKDLGLDLVNRPDCAAEFPTAALIPGWFWKRNGLNALADKDDIESVTRRVNGGLNGLASRKAYLVKAKAALADLKGALLAGAAQETAKAKAKTQGAATATAPAAALASIGAIPSDATHAALGAGGEWALIVAGIALAGLAVWLFLSIRKHQDAAAALTIAAKGA
jgi:putative chitinase